MQKAYQNAMTTFRRHGKPTWMVTFTGNSGWEEVKDAMPKESGDNTADRPDIICRIFEDKVHEIRKDLEDRGVLGKCIAHVEAREFQKRGMPHFHKLLTLDPKLKSETGDFVDQYITAEIPELPDVNDHSEKAKEDRLYHE